MYFAYFYCCGDEATLSAAWAAAREAGGKIGNYSFLGEYPDLEGYCIPFSNEPPRFTVPGARVQVVKGFLGQKRELVADYNA